LEYELFHKGGVKHYHQLKKSSVDTHLERKEMIFPDLPFTIKEEDSEEEERETGIHK
jgi:hypothetical protein